MTFQVAALTNDLHREDADNLAVKYKDRMYIP